MAPSAQLLRPRHSKRKGRQQSSRYGEEEATRLPYLVDAALRLRGREPGAWTAEERNESEQTLSKTSVVRTQEKNFKAKRGEKYVPRLLLGDKAGLKRGKKNPDDPAGGYVLPTLDERVLILYHSSLKRAWKQQQQQLEANVPTSSLPHYGHEAIYAATQIQKMIRGMAARKEWRTFYCLRNQSAATRIQLAFRRVVVRQKVLARLARKRNDRATHIQAWYRRHRCRELLLYQHIRVMNQRIANFQRYIRGRRLWRIVMAILYKRRSDVVTEIQRCYRGWKGRQRAVAIRFEQSQHVRQLRHESMIHAQHPRCNGCSLEICTEDSLFACFMARYLGLHDFKGARTLCEDGLRLFPSSAKFLFFLSVLLQSMCEDIESSLAFLKRAKAIGITKEQIFEVKELNCYYNTFWLPLTLIPIATYGCRSMRPNFSSLRICCIQTMPKHSSIWQFSAKTVMIFLAQKYTTLRRWLSHLRSTEFLAIFTDCIWWTVYCSTIIGFAQFSISDKLMCCSRRYLLRRRARGSV